MLKYTYKFLWKSTLDGLYHEKHIDAPSKRVAEADFEALFGPIEEWGVQVERLHN